MAQSGATKDSGFRTPQGPKTAPDGNAPAASAKSTENKANEESNTGQVAVDVVGMHSGRGRLEVGLYRDAEGFPQKRVFVGRILPVTGANQRVVFDGIPPGPFAIAVHHDENGNGKMDTGLFGLPSEGYGFSRDAKVMFGPPSFESAALMLAPGERVKVTLHMRY